MGNEFNWSAMDFVVAGCILFLLTVGLVFISKKINRKYRLAASAGFVLFIAIIWVEMAVGIFGSSLAGS